MSKKRDRHDIPGTGDVAAAGDQMVATPLVATPLVASQADTPDAGTPDAVAQRYIALALLMHENQIYGGSGADVSTELSAFGFSKQHIQRMIDAGLIVVRSSPEE